MTITAKTAEEREERTEAGSWKRLHGKFMIDRHNQRLEFFKQKRKEKEG